MMRLLVVWREAGIGGYTVDWAAQAWRIRGGGGISLPETGCCISKVSPSEIRSNQSPWDHSFHGHARDQQQSSKLPPIIFHLFAVILIYIVELSWSQHLTLLRNLSTGWMVLLQVVHAVLQVLNQIIQDNADLLENACFVGMVISVSGYDSVLLHKVLATKIVMWRWWIPPLFQMSSIWDLCIHLLLRNALMSCSIHC